MKLSEDRASHLAHKTADVLQLSVGGDAQKLLAGVKKAFRDFERVLEEINRGVEQKIASLKRNVPEGSREWDILYRQYFDEEMKKHGV